MKKILSAYIYEVIQFDDLNEYNDYIKDLKSKNQRFEIKSVEIIKDNAVRLKIKRQYNKAKFI